MTPRPPLLLRCLWPITDEATPWPQLLADACTDIPLLARRSHVTLAGPTQWCAARSVDVPGSGRTTEFVLLAHTPAYLTPKVTP